MKTKAAELNCKGCGETLKTKPYLKRQFCSRLCWKNWRANRNAFNELVETPSSDRPCEICEKIFRPEPKLLKRGYGLYCSRICAGLGKRKANESDYEVRIDWYASHGWTALSKKLRNRKKKCQKCGKKGRLVAHHLIDPFPSRNMALLLNEKNIKILCHSCHHKTHAKIPRTKTRCKFCKKLFEHASNKKKVFCNIDCMIANKQKKTRICLTCKKDFIPSHSTARCCSPSCAKKRAAVVKLARRLKRTCPWCGTKFSVPPSRVKKGRPRRPCCSRDCAVVYRTNS